MFIDTAFFTSNASLAGYLWLTAALLLILSELSAPGLFFFISFSAGCVVGAGAAFLQLSIFTQLCSTIISSVIAFIIMRSVFTKKHGLKLKTNIDALHHAEAIVTKTIESNKTGLVKVRGELWPATTLEHATLHPGTRVKIIKVNGNKLIVTQ